jgi:flagellar biosynthetic protein FliR
MMFSVDVAWVLTVVLVALRISAAVAMTPVLGVTTLPPQVRTLFVVALAATLVAGMALPINASVVTLNHFLVAAASELAIGLALAFGLFTAFATFMLAGRIIDMQLGFGVAGLIDPATRTQAPLIGYFLNLVAVMLFFSVDGHHALIRGFAYSLEVLPPGTALSEIDMGAIVAQFGSMFVYALVVAAPVMFVVLLIDIVLAVIARTMPQMNVFIVGLPLKIFVGLTVLALSLGYLAPAFKRVFETLFNYWHVMLS